MKGNLTFTFVTATSTVKTSEVFSGKSEKSNVHKMITADNLVILPAEDWSNQPATEDWSTAPTAQASDWGGATSDWS